MKAFIIGLIIGILLVPAAFYYYVQSGKAPVATVDSPMPFERYFAKTALHARIRAQAPKQVPIQPDDNVYMTGAHIYRENCAVCHGLPSQPETAPAKGMFPHPPQLFQPDHMVTDDPPGVTFWKAKNGIRLSGMPGFHASLNDQQLWSVSLLLAHADKLPPTVTQTLSAPPPADTTVAAPAK
jgi:thiosulfate dehydrogenase